MQKKIIKSYLDKSYLSYTNRLWIEKLYKEFLINPNFVDSKWREYFNQISKNYFYNQKKKII